jgi:hypothetical protein
MMSYPTPAEVATADQAQLRTWITDLPASISPEERACIIHIIERLVSFWPRRQRTLLPMPEAPATAAVVRPATKQTPKPTAQPEPETTGSLFFMQQLTR